ncbi:HupE/UreJ family protein [Vibrio variabilis]|uniref:HupE/UreJ family protein n=1 Tax=Vibrio variabilis TaxID=990271 RepID=UPI001EFA2996|nr:HupE/UreJ family protein [Vibrio variabilis]
MNSSYWSSTEVVHLKGMPNDFAKSKALVSFIWLVALTLISASLAQADDMRPTSLTIQATDETTSEVIFKVPAAGGRVINLGVAFGSDTKNVSVKNNYFTADAYVQTWNISREGSLAGLEISIDGLERNSADVLLRAVDLEGNTQTKVLNVEQPDYVLPSQLSAQGAFVTYVKIGIDHILVGLDHLLFVSCLIFISATRRKLLQTITGFTVAHSITLILATTGQLDLPIVPVEAVIALSIVFLAWEIAKDKRDSLSLKHPVLVSSSFGLLHGFGFATVLSDIGLPQDDKFVALAAFNVGVEIGQLMFVGVACSLFILLGKVYQCCNKQSLRLYVSYGCGVVAMFWLFERLSAFPVGV